MFHKRLSIYGKRLKSSLVALLFVGTQIVFPIAMSGVASAAVPPPLPSSDCTVDTAGANDVPNQKDLNQMCADTSALPVTEHITWNWDELGSSGANTLDACALFDTNGDGNAEYSACVTTLGNPATLSALTVYSCNNTSSERCFGSAVVPAPLSAASCQVYQQGSDPFNASAPNGPGDSYPNDTVADCTIHLSEVGGQSTANLIDVCSYPSSSPNSSPSDCVIAQPKSGKLEVVKHLVPTTDTGKFNLQVDGTTKATDVSNNGTTGEVVVSAANHSVGELAGTGTNLSSYNSTIECRDQNGTGTVVAATTGNGTSLSGVPVADGSDIVCVITNTHQQATLILQKTVVNNNGGTLTQSSFPVFIGGNTSSWGSHALNPGTYTVSETTQTGYQPGSWGGDCSAGGSVTLTDGQTKTCTITNDDIAPTLTLVKDVTNDNGGQRTLSEWTLTATGASASPTNLSGAGGATSGSNFKADTYTLGESGPADYSANSWSCTNGVTVNANSQITLTNNQTTTCTITNDDIAPTLKLVKNVNNSVGGTASATDWTLYATPSDNHHSTLSGAGGFNFQTAWANDPYTLSESNGPAGYTPGSWSCDNNLSVNANSEVTLPLDKDVTCNITNTRDTGTVRVNKTLLPSTDTGTFNLNISGTDNFDFTALNQGNNGTTGTKTVDTGTYTVSEGGNGSTDLSNYLSNYECKDGNTTVKSGSLTPANSYTSDSFGVTKGQNIICTLTNTHKASISGTKYEVNSDGSNVGPIQSWTIYLLVSGSQNPLSTTTAADGSFSFTGLDPSQSYTLSEDTSNTSYTQLTFNNSTCSSISYSFGLTPGENSTANDFCNFKDASISGYKFNDLNGNHNWDTATEPVIGDWTVNLYQGSDTSVTPYQTKTTDHSTGKYLFDNLAPGDYTVCEKTDSQPGYVQTFPTTNGGCYLVTVALSGTDYSDRDFGNQGRGHIIVDKVTDPSGDPQSFNFSTTGTGYNGFSLTDAAAPNDQEVAAGSYTVSESTLTGWDLTDSSCDNHQSPDAITVGAGQTITCTFTNTKRGSVTIVKDAQPDSSQAFTFTGNLQGNNGPNFDLIDDGSHSGTEQKVFSNLEPGTYNATEPNVHGWDLASITCTGGADASQDKTNNRNAVIKLQPGENVICTFVNKAVPPTLTVIKQVDNANGNNKSPSDFTMHVTNTASANDASFPGNDAGTTVTMNTGSYTVTEDNLPGYTSSGDCSGTLDLGDNATCTITNTSNAPSLTITKTNDKPNVTVDGDTVTYTLVVTVPTDSGTVFDASVVDLPPSNFTVDPNSTSATLTDTDNSTSSLNISPNYGSPGIWNLGTLKPGQKVTLIYKAKIGSNVSNGTYPDLAFTSGCKTPGCSPANVTGNLNASTPFVGTKVAVAAVITPATFAAGQVLGAEVLVNTGTNLLAAQYILPIVLLSGVYLIRRWSATQGGK